MTSRETTSSTSGRSLLIRRRYDLLALAALAVAICLFFWPVVAGTAWIPRGGGDAVSFIFPMYRFAAQSLREGVIPLWNPYQYAGHPFIADNQTGLFYPLNLALFILQPKFSYRAIEGLLILHFFIAGAGMYISLRLLRRSGRVAPAAALVGALAFMFSGVFITHIGNLNLIAVAVWLPLLFLALHRAINATMKPEQLAWSIGGGALFGLATLAGHGQITFLLAGYLIAYALYRSVSDRRLSPILSLAVMGAVAIGVAAISLFPALAALDQTTRASLTPEQAANYSLTWPALLGLFAPNFFGRGEILFWGPWSRVEYGYVGVLTLLLAATAIVLRRNKLTWFWALSIPFFLLLALGANGALYPLILRLLPGFPFQVPARFVLLVDFSLAALAAIGFNELLRRPRPIRAFLVGATLAAAGITAIAFWQYRSYSPAVPHHAGQMLSALLTLLGFATAGVLLVAWRSESRSNTALFAVLAIVLLAADLIGLGRNVEIEPNDPRPGFAAGSPALAFVQSQAGMQRIDIATGAWQPNLPQLEGLFSIGGVFNPLQLSRYAAYIGSVGFRGSPQYNLLGTKFIVGGTNEPPGDTRILAPVFNADPNVIIYLNTLALPRAAVVYNAVSVADDGEAFTAIHGESFMPQEQVIVEGGPPLNQEPGQSSIVPLNIGLNNLTFDVTTDKAGYFLLSDMYHPDWQATINGEPATIYPADYAFRALLLQPGEYRIEMDYVPAGWRLGWMVSALTWLGTFLFFVWYWRTAHT